MFNLTYLQKARYNVMMGTIKQQEIENIKKLYYDKQLSIKKIANECNISVNALTYFMRKHNLKRRTPSENSKINFDKKELSFKEGVVNDRNKELVAFGIALYWAEGYKTEKSSGIDFANSDPSLVKIFLSFLRTLYMPNEKRFRVYLYCHSHEVAAKNIAFWSRITGIPKKQFLKPYIQQKIRKSGRIMKHGLIHVRYNDKKLLFRVREFIDQYQTRFSNI